MALASALLPTDPDALRVFAAGLQAELARKDVEIAANAAEIHAKAAGAQAAAAASAARNGHPRAALRLPGANRIAISPGCGGTVFSRVGQDEREVLEYVPSSFKVIRHVRPKLSCRACETVVQQPMPALLIECGRPGAWTARACAGVQVVRPPASWDGGLPRMLIGHDLSACSFRVDRQGRIHAAGSGVVMSGPVTRRALLVCVSSDPHPIALGRFLTAVFS